MSESSALPRSPQESAAVLQRARESGDVPNLKPCPLIRPALSLDPPYKVAILHFLLQKRMLLKDPVGVGKTASALGAYAYYRHTSPEQARVIVLGTSSAQFQWRSETSRLTTLTAKVYGYEGSRELDREARRARYLAMAPGEVDLWVMTYELAAIEKEILTERPFVLIFDEIQLLRGARGKVTRPAARELSQHASAVWGLSATPYMKKVEDLWGIYDSLVPGLLGNIYQYQHLYVRTMDLQRKDKKTGKYVGPRFKKIIGYQNLPHLRARIAPFTLSRTEADFGDFMPVVSPLERLDVKMGPEQRKAYTSYLQQLPDEHGVVSIKQKANAVMYAQMLTDAPEVLGVNAPSAKFDRLVEYLNETVEDEQMVCYTFFASVAKWLVKSLKAKGIDAAMITGSMSAPARAAVQDGFEAKKHKIVIVTNAAVYSVNLRCKFFGFYDLPWVWGNAVQAVGRARRRALPGQPPGTLTVVAFMATGTVNERTLTCLRKSQEVNSDVYAPLTSTRRPAADPSTLSKPRSGIAQIPQQNALLRNVQVVGVVAALERSSSDLISLSEIEREDLALDTLVEEETSVTALWASLRANEFPADEGPGPVFVPEPLSEREP